MSWQQIYVKFDTEQINCDSNIEGEILAIIQCQNNIELENWNSA